MDVVHGEFREEQFPRSPFLANYRAYNRTSNHSAFAVWRSSRMIGLGGTRRATILKPALKKVEE